MRILFCCQFYAPSVGGVQELIRQVAEKLALKGHHVTVATTKLAARNFEELNGVNIKEFDVSGNLVTGMVGEVSGYQEYVISGGFDGILIYAAQQWTFDALWPVLDKILYPKIFSPCGFSGLYESGYAKYFQQMPEILKKFDHLVFNANKYRDIDFALENDIKNYTVIPNAASEEEFSVAIDPSFRMNHGILEESFLFLTVGSFTGLKGHLELVKAFALLQLPEGQHATLILNGNEVEQLGKNIGSLLDKTIGLVKTHGMRYTALRIAKLVFGTSASPKKIADFINKSQPDKRVMVTNFPRAELTQAFMAADLFVFASNIEHSPLVLFESAAAGTPFLSVDVGNAAEIAQWTGAGVMCPSSVDKKGYTRVNVAVLAQSMAELMQQGARLKELGAIGKQKWLEGYTWGKISARYEQVFYQLKSKSASI